MTVKELKEELSFYDEDADVVFEVFDDFEPDSVTENKYGWRTVSLNCKLKPTFICECRGDCRIELGKDDER